MAPTPTPEADGFTSLLVASGFAQGRPHFDAEPQFDLLEGILQRTIKVIRGESNEAVAFRVNAEEPVWSLAFVPEGVRAVGSGASTAARGGIWHISDPHLLLTGWGYVSHKELDGFLAGECRILTPPYHPEGDVPYEFGYCCQLDVINGEPGTTLARRFAEIADH